MNKLRRVAICLLGVAAAIAFPSAAAAKARIATPPANCDFSSLTYFAYTASALTACGLDVWPLTAVNPLPGGGQAYVYDEGGGVVTELVPPPAFDPLTATSAQLDEYGFPPMPSTPTLLDHWRQEMSNWQGASTPEAFDVSNPQVQLESSGDWAGYGVYKTTFGAFTHAETSFIQPELGSSQCSPTVDGIWAGIGGWNGKDLAQDGTTHGLLDVSGRSFWEVVPSGSNPGDGPHAMNLIGHPDYTFDASTRRISGGYRFFIHNNYSNTTEAIDVTNSKYDYYSGYSAEAIVEHPPGSFNGLANFQKLQFTEADADGTYFDQFPLVGSHDTAGLHEIWMYDQLGRLMADTGSIGFYGAFNAYQHRCD